jgi:short-subunit dehydrogenase
MEGHEPAMTVSLKPVRDQVMVITGASSGIGLVTARLAAKRGARVVVTARNEAALRQLVQELDGHRRDAAACVAADVSDEPALRRVADEAQRRFGRIDTWVNCAGASIYGRATDVSLEDQRQLFETNFWGVVHGSRIAVEYLRGRGGALINIGSTLSDVAVPLQAAYSASKHAVKAYTDALRIEVEHDRLPVVVTLIKPYAIDTPYIRHAKNYLSHEPAYVPPVYAPDVVAETVLHCAEHPVRDVFAGGSGKLMSAANYYAPRLMDRIMEATMFDLQQSDQPEHDRSKASLYGATSELKERGEHRGHVSESSLYTRASLHPLLTGTLMAMVGLTIVSLLRSAGNGQPAAQLPSQTSDLF